jgi:hypothetical protein
MKKPILIALAAFGISVMAGIMVLLVMVGLGPETCVVPGRQLPARYLSRLQREGGRQEVLRVSRTQVRQGEGW